MQATLLSKHLDIPRTPEFELQANLSYVEYITV